MGFDNAVEQGRKARSLVLYHGVYHGITGRMDPAGDNGLILRFCSGVLCP